MKLKAGTVPGLVAWLSLMTSRIGRPTTPTHLFYLLDSELGALNLTLLAEKNLTVADLYQILQKRGFAVNRKSLYRLAASQPVQKLDTAIARAVCEALDVRLQDLIQFQKPRFELKHLQNESRGSNRSATTLGGAGNLSVTLMGKRHDAE